MSTLATPRRTTHVDSRRVLRRTQRTDLTTRIVRLAIAVAMIAFGIFVMFSERAVRMMETDIATQIFAVTFADDAIRAMSDGEPAIAFGYGEDWWALRVTVECAIALYLGPVIMIGGLLSAVPRMNLLRVFTATSLSVLAMLVLNQVRLLMLGFVLGLYGKEGFEWAHSLVGSFLMMFGLAGCLFLFFRIVVLGSIRSRVALIES